MASRRKEVFMVEWVINHISGNRYFVGDKVVSKPFTVSKLGYTRWRLELYPKGLGNQIPANNLSLFLRRLPSEPRHVEYSYKEEITIDIKFVIVEVSCTDLLGSRFSVFDANGIKGVAEFPAGKSALEISAFLSIPERRIHNAKSGYLSLSDDMRRLLNNSVYFNVEIVCGKSSHKRIKYSKKEEEKVFNVHRNILMCRAPVLADKLDLRYILGDSVTRHPMENISPSVLQSILTYIYTGTTDNSPEALTQELFKVAREYKMHDLVASLTPLADDIRCESEYKVEEFYSCWSFTREEENESPMVLYQERGIDECYFDKIIMTCEAPHDIFSKLNTRIKVSIRLLGFKREIPVYFVLKVEHEGNLVSPNAVERLIIDGEWAEDVLLVFKNYALPLPTPLRLLLKFSLFDGGQSIERQTENNLRTVHDRTICDLYKLSHDMFQLYKSAINTNFKLINNTNKFKVHKSILAARSPHYSTMIENGAKQADCSHLSESGMNTLLSYLYKGSVPDMDYETALEMYEEAERCVMEELQRTCSEYLVKHLGPSNHRELARFAESHDDDLLRSCCALWAERARSEG